MKYIIFKHNTILMPIIFPEHITHSSINIEIDDKGNRAIPISAGFLNMKTFQVYGVSESLGLQGGPLDSKYLQFMLAQFPTSAYITFDQSYNKPFKIIKPKKS